MLPVALAHALARDEVVVVARLVELPLEIVLRLLQPHLVGHLKLNVTLVGLVHEHLARSADVKDPERLGRPIRLTSQLLKHQRTTALTAMVRGTEASEDFTSTIEAHLPRIASTAG